LFKENTRRPLNEFHHEWNSLFHYHCTIFRVFSVKKGIILKNFEQKTEHFMRFIYLFRLIFFWHLYKNVQHSLVRSNLQLSEICTLAVFIFKQYYSDGRALSYKRTVQNVSRAWPLRLCAGHPRRNRFKFKRNDKSIYSENDSGWSSITLDYVSSPKLYFECLFWITAGNFEKWPFRSIAVAFDWSVTINCFRTVLYCSEKCFSNTSRFPSTFLTK